MRIMMRFLPGGIVALLVVALAACGGDGPSPEGSVQQTGGPDTPGATTTAAAAGAAQHAGAKYADLAVSNGTDVLGASSQRWHEDVSSVRSEFQFNVTAMGTKMGGTGEFVYQAPDQMHMTMDLTGIPGLTSGSSPGKMELLMRDGTAYMNSPFTGWIKVSLEDLGPDGASFEKLLSSHSLFDFDSLLAGLGGGVTFVGEESLRGEAVAHYKVNADLNKLLDSITEAMSGPTGGQLLPSGGASAPVALDIWVGKESLLPAKVSASGVLNIASLNMSVDMTMDFYGYNGPVTVPDAPSDAQSLADAFGGIMAGMGSGSGN
jgi:hypothetical protein